MYTLAHKKLYVQPNEGFGLFNSLIPAVNGDYHKLVIDGHDEPEYVVPYLINNGKLVLINLDNDIYQPIYTNGNCYVYYNPLWTGIIPISGGDNNYYYLAVGGAQSIRDKELDMWSYNNEYNDNLNEHYWDDKLFPDIIYYDENFYY